MSSPKRHHFEKRHLGAARFAASGCARTHAAGAYRVESAYLKSLIDSRAKVTVVLMSGERLQGRIRYYDSDCFSIGLSAAGPRIFLTQRQRLYMLEDNPS